MTCSKSGDSAINISDCATTVRLERRAEIGLISITELYSESLKTNGSIKWATYILITISVRFFQHGTLILHKPLLHYPIFDGTPVVDSCILSSHKVITINLN